MRRRIRAIAALLLFIAVTIGVYAATAIGERGDEEPEVNKNLTFILNPDGTLGVTGKITAIIKGKQGATGTLTLTLHGAPYEFEGKTFYKGAVDADGKFKLSEEPEGLENLKLTLEASQIGLDSATKINATFSMSNATGWVKLVAETTATGESMMEAHLTIDFDINTPISEDTASYLRKQLSQIQAPLLNLLLARSGVTFVEITKADLSKVEITTEGAAGTVKLDLNLNMTEYFEWLKGKAYEQGASEEDIENALQPVIKAYSKIYQYASSKDNKIDLKIQITLSGVDLDISLHGLLNLRKEYVQALAEYMGSLSEASSVLFKGSLGTTEELNIPELNETLLPREKINLTLAPEPLDISAALKLEETGGSFELNIKELHLKVRNATIGYESSLRALRELGGLLEDEKLDEVTVEAQPYNGKAPTIKIPVEAQDAIVSREDSMVVLKDLKASLLSGITLEDIPKVTSITTTAQTTQAASQSQTTQAETSTSTPQQKTKTTSNLAVTGGIVAIIVLAVAAFVLKSRTYFF